MFWFWNSASTFGGQQYVVSDVRKTWYDARDSCEKGNATLAIVTSVNESASVQGLQEAAGLAP